MTKSNEKEFWQNWINAEYEAWITTYAPKQYKGKKAFKEIQKVGPEYVWTEGNSFEQEYLSTPDGNEISSESITITPGVSEGDSYWICKKSWKDAEDDYSDIFVEVVIRCQTCVDSNDNSAGICKDCDGTNEWIFTPNSFFS